MRRTFRTRSVIAACCSIVCTAPLHAQVGIAPNDIERVGQSGWQFLKINGDPRQAAIGGAFTATSHGDANAVFGNPAAVAEVVKYDLQLNTVRWVADITHQSAAFAANWEGIGVFAFSFVTLDYGDIAETVNALIPGENRTEAVVTGNFFTARDLAVGLSYGRKITNKLALGGSVRWLQQSIAELDMTNWSLDFGTVYYTGFKSLRLAMSARNFGPDSHLTGWSEQYQAEPDDIRMPIDFRVGLAMDFLNERNGPHLLTVALDGDHPNDGPEKFHFGTEFHFDKKLALRAGYRFNYDEQGLTLGAGVNYDFSGLRGSANYAFVDFGALSQVHMFSFGIAF
ncbi:MAG: PorV/PorQ family protein [bacterium]